MKLVVFNNSALGFVELEMKAAGLVDYGTDMVRPNFANLAEAAEILGVRAVRSGRGDEVIDLAKTNLMR